MISIEQIVALLRRPRPSRTRGIINLVPDFKPPTSTPMLLLRLVSVSPNFIDVAAGLAAA
jgi:hypothetical protein